MSRQLKWSLGLLGGAIVIAVLMVALRPAPEGSERVEQVPLVEVIPFKAASGSIPVVASGTVEAKEEMTVATQVSGRISYVNRNFKEGGVVRAGATLVQIEAADFENQVRIAQADVATQDVAVLRAREEVDIARDELRRFATREASGSAVGGGSAKQGASSQILPPTQLAEKAIAPAQLGEGNPQQAGNLATREPQLRAAEAARERAAASLAVAQLSLDRTRATAPFRGLVRQENASIGTVVQAGQSLGSIVSTAAFDVRLSLAQDEMALLPALIQSRGANVPASVFYEFGGVTYRWNAVVDRVDAILDPSTRNVEVFLRVAAPLSGGMRADEEDQEQGQDTGPAPPLLLGAFVTAEIGGMSLASYAIVPSAALRPGNEIWIVRDGKLKIVPVRVIQRTDENAYVVTPEIAEGGQLVVSNLTTPVDGLSVRTAGQDAQ